MVLVVTRAAKQHEGAALGTRLDELGHRPIFGCRAEGDFSALDNGFRVDHVVGSARYL